MILDHVSMMVIALLIPIWTCWFIAVHKSLREQK